MKKLIVVAPLLLGLALSAAAQMPPPGGGPQGGPPAQGPPPEAFLKEFLGFTTAQLDALHNLIDARAQAVQALNKQLAEAEKALAEAANATTPDPTIVGTKFLAVTGLRKQVGQAEEGFKAGFENLLTAEQKSKVDAVKGLQAGLTAGQVLRGLGAI